MNDSKQHFNVSNSIPSSIGSGNLRGCFKSEAFQERKANNDSTSAFLPLTLINQQYYPLPELLIEASLNTYQGKTVAIVPC